MPGSSLNLGSSFCKYGENIHVVNLKRIIMGKVKATKSVKHNNLGTKCSAVTAQYYYVFHAEKQLLPVENRK